MLRNQTVISIPNPINTNLFKPRNKKEARAHCKLPQEGKLILFGSVKITDKRKGIDYLIESCKLLAEKHPELKASLGVVAFGNQSQQLSHLLPFPVYALEYVSNEHDLVNIYNAVEATAKAILDFNGSGLSLMEISHRAKDFQPVVDEAVALFKELLNIPEGYSVLFLGGGASMEFCMVPFNFLEKKAAYLNTGVWAKKAMKEAKAFGEVVEVASSAEATYTYIPKDYTVPADADYFHITTNNTIYGTELKEDLNVNVPMIADMSSDIFSRPIDVSKYICIYGGAQKNLAPSGVTFVIVKNDALGKVSRYIPTMLNYQTHVDSGSMFNTPPVVPIYAALQTLRWIKAQGGVKEMERRAIEKADMLYAEIDRNKMFVGTAAQEDRSRMNICFVMAPEYKELEADFMKFATERGMVGIKGHRSVGGFRASCYNAMPKESVQALIDCMQEFEKLH